MAPESKPDSNVDFIDVAVFAEYWLVTVTPGK
jgi:hypothetical protein